MYIKREDYIDNMKKKAEGYDTLASVLRGLVQFIPQDGKRFDKRNVEQMRAYCVDQGGLGVTFSTNVFFHDEKQLRIFIIPNIETEFRTRGNSWYANGSITDRKRLEEEFLEAAERAGRISKDCLRSIENIDELNRRWADYADAWQRVKDLGMVDLDIHNYPYSKELIY